MGIEPVAIPPSPPPFSSSKRPDRLISKLKTMNLEDLARGGKRIVVLRQPRGPDNSPGAGFKARKGCAKSASPPASSAGAAAPVAPAAGAAGAAA